MFWKLFAVAALVVGAPAWAQGGSIPPTSTIQPSKTVRKRPETLEKSTVPAFFVFYGVR